jgi:hypothetical protein
MEAQAIGQVAYLDQAAESTPQTHPLGVHDEAHQLRTKAVVFEQDGIGRQRRLQTF